MRIAEQIRDRKRAKRAPRRQSAEAIVMSPRCVLAPRDWNAFVERLDNPPAPNAKLKALFARRPIWDR